MKKVQDKVDDRFNWFNQRSNEMGSCPPTKNPPVYPSQIETEKKVSVFFLEINDKHLSISGKRVFFFKFFYLL